MCVWLCLFAFEFVCMCVFVLYGRVLDVFMCECLCVCVIYCFVECFVFGAEECVESVWIGVC